MIRSQSDAVTRQHEATELSELYGVPCDEFLAVCRASGEIVGPFYLRLKDSWQRFYFDAGILFWDEGGEPNEDDLLDDEDLRRLRASKESLHLAEFSG